MGSDLIFRSMNVADVLDLTVSEAVQLFRDDREVLRVLQPIVDVGLEYVKLGQPVPTLSGGEAQRLQAGGLTLAGPAGKSARGAAPNWPAAGSGQAPGQPRHALCSCSTSPPPACTSTTSPS